MSKAVTDRVVKETPAVAVAGAVTTKVLAAAALTETVPLVPVTLVVAVSVAVMV